MDNSTASYWELASNVAFGNTNATSFSKINPDEFFNATIYEKKEPEFFNSGSKIGNEFYITDNRVADKTIKQFAF